MKHLFILLFAFLLVACASTDQKIVDPTEVVVTQCVDQYVPVSHPELPKSIPAPSIDIEVITPSVMHTRLVEHINADKELTAEEKIAYVEFSEVVRDLWLVNDGYVYYAMGEDSAKNMSVYFEDIKAFLTSNKQVVQHYLSKPIYVKSAEAYSLEN